MLRDEVTDASVLPQFVVIYRGIETTDILAATESLLRAGYTCFEVSLTSPNAVEAIRELVRNFSGDALIGAGTVRSAADVDAVFDAGARLVLSPETDPDVIRRSKSHGMLTIPGAYTPTEVSSAHRRGADVVKIFPIGASGAEYFRLLRDPFPDIPLLVTGGVTAAAAKSYLAAGAVSVGVGVQLLAGDAVRERQWNVVGERAAAYRRTAVSEI